MGKSLQSFIKNRFLLQDFARIQDSLWLNPGLFIMTRSVRSYPSPLASSRFGYIGEISGSDNSKEDSSKYYTQGDYVALAEWELIRKKEDFV